MTVYSVLSDLSAMLPLNALRSRGVNTKAVRKRARALDSRYCGPSARAIFQTAFDNISRGTERVGGTLILVKAEMPYTVNTSTRYKSFVKRLLCFGCLSN